MVKELTFNELPQAVAELQQQQAVMMNFVKEIGAKIVQYIQQREADNEPSGADKLVFGIFYRQERLRMCDERLWSLPTSPFHSKRQVYRAKENGCPFTRPENQRIWTIKATDLEKWFAEWGKTDIS